MFGDAGHGTLMALFGAWMVIREAKLQANKTDNEVKHESRLNETFVQDLYKIETERPFI